MRPGHLLYLETPKALSCSVPSEARALLRSLNTVDARWSSCLTNLEHSKAQTISIATVCCLAKCLSKNMPSEIGHLHVDLVTMENSVLGMTNQIACFPVDM